MVNTNKDLVWLRWFDFGQRNLQPCDAPLQLRELVISECQESQGFPKFEEVLEIVGVARLFKELMLLQRLDLGECSNFPLKLDLLENMTKLGICTSQKASNWKSCSITS
ncbi:hypothetical protein SUGI_0364550 [Cryptomeria japonica]|nr:hypothetical protein SUGI_0364550 [Cryptomeria japonica]